MDVINLVIIFVVFVISFFDMENIIIGRMNWRMWNWYFENIIIGRMNCCISNWYFENINIGRMNWRISNWFLESWIVWQFDVIRIFTFFLAGLSVLKGYHFLRFFLSSYLNSSLFFASTRVKLESFKVVVRYYFFVFIA